jgi:hypothetical protein
LSERWPFLTGIAALEGDGVTGYHEGEADHDARDIASEKELSNGYAPRYHGVNNHVMARRDDDALGG